jgi:hypothetical protein
MDRGPVSVTTQSNISRRTTFRHPRIAQFIRFLAKKRQAFAKIRQGKADRGINFKWIQDANSNPPPRSEEEAG